jgi:hypothetical protein
MSSVARQHRSAPRTHRRRNVERRAPARKVFELHEPPLQRGDRRTAAAAATAAARRSGTTAIVKVTHG